jgi:hypothetical protein
MQIFRLEQAKISVNLLKIAKRKLTGFAESEVPQRFESKPPLLGPDLALAEDNSWERTLKYFINSRGCL